MTSRENQLDLSGHRPTREARKAALLADLRECDRERLLVLLSDAKRRIDYLRKAHEIQLGNGMPVTDETLARNLARPLLELECLNEILSE